VGGWVGTSVLSVRQVPQNRVQRAVSHAEPTPPPWWRGSHARALRSPVEQLLGAPAAPTAAGPTALHLVFNDRFARMHLLHICAAVIHAPCMQHVRSTPTPTLAFGRTSCGVATLCCSISSPLSRASQEDMASSVQPFVRLLQHTIYRGSVPTMLEAVRAYAAVGAKPEVKHAWGEVHKLDSSMYVPIRCRLKASLLQTLP
jgi:hypothetical protein